MNDRDCENCKHHTEKGCDSWDCEFEQKMTKEEIHREKEQAYMQGYEDASKKYRQELCEDAISRQYLLDNCVVDRVTMPYVPINKIENAPPVTPQPKMGKWIEIEVHNCHATLKCSVCDRVIKPTFTFGGYSYEDIKTFYPYCHCGAKMQEGEE